MHDYSVVFLIYWMYFFIPAVLIFLIIWYLTKNKDITHQVKFWRVLPFSLLLSPALLPESTGLNDVLLPSIIGVILGSPVEKLLYLLVILSFTLIGWLMYVFIERSNEKILLQEMKFQQEQERLKNQNKLQKLNLKEKD